MKKVYTTMIFAVMLLFGTTAKSQCTDYATVPYATGFEGYNTDAMPACWLQVQSDTRPGFGTFPCCYNYSGNARNGDVYFEMESTTGAVEMCALPMMQNISGLILSFWASAQSSYLPTVFEVGVLEDSVFVPVDTINLITSTNWQTGYHEYTVYFVNYSGYGDRIAMRAHRTSGQYTIMIDDLSVSEDNGCYPITSISATDIDSDAVTLSWLDEMNSGISYTVTYWTATGDTVVVSNITDTAYTVTGLNANTLYNFMVTPNCSGGDGIPSTVQVRTACGTTTIPYSEGFEGLPTGSAPNCWTVLNGNPRVMTNVPRTGSQHLYFQGGTPNAIALPPTDQPTGDLQVRFWTRPESFTSSSCGNFEVGYMTDLNVDSTFVMLASWAYNTFSAYEEKEVPMVGAPADAYIVIRQNNNASYYYWYVDDLVVEPIPSCARPVSVSADSVTSTSVDLTIVGTGTTYRIYYNDGYTTDSVDVTDTVYTLTGLNASTSYTISVATVCDDNTVTPTVSTSIRTLCAADACTVTFAMTDDFGDGWNGAGIYGIVNGVNFFNATMTSGSTGSYTYSHCSTDTLELRWHSGSFDDECDFTVSIGGIQIAAGNGSDYSNNALLVQTIGCPSCGAPYDMVVYGVGSDEASITWNGSGATDFRIYINDGTTTDSIDVTDTVYTFTNLTASTAYTVYVATICDDASLTYGNPVSFSTFCTDGGCALVIDMVDSYGDGWNGHAVNVTISQDTTLNFTATIASGNTNVFTYNLCGPDTVLLTWTTGDYPGEVSFTITAGGTVIAAGGGNDFGDGDTLGYFIGCPTCPTPSNYAVDSLAVDAVTFHWVPGGSETEWVVTVGDTTFITTAPNAVVSGLNSNTYYDVTIAAICGAGDTSLTIHGGFRTNCGVAAIPYTEGFESMDTYVSPICWTMIGGDIEVTNYDSHTGNNALVFTGSSGNEAIALPEMAQPTGTLQVRCWIMSEGYSDCGTFEIGYMTDLNVDSTYVMVSSWSYNAAANYTEVEVPLVGAPDSARIVMRQNGGDWYYWYVDDITVEPAPACPRPSQLNAVGVTDNQIDVTFAGSASGNYIIYITDSVAYADSAAITADSTHSFTGLTQLTTYYITIVADCGTEVSPSRTISVTTTMVADTLPLSTGFEPGQDTNWMFFNSGQVNQWYIGSAVNNGGNRALYISNDNGTTNAYDITSTSNVYVAKLLAFDSIGDYAVSFDWNANGESNYDYLRAFIVPSSVQLVAGDMSGITYSTTPTGWIALDGGNKLNQSSNWQSRSEVFTIANAGNYQLVFFWYNDGSLGTNPPAAIDNVQIMRLSCPQPQNIVFDAITDVSATIHWTAAGSEGEWAVTCNGITTYVTTTSATVTGLSAGTAYSMQVRAVCGAGDTSLTTTAQFSTAMCSGASVAENWDTTMNATTSSYSPIGYSFYNYGYVQTIIDSATMAAIGTGEINAFAFYPASATSGSYYTNMDIYMANVPESDLSSGYIHPDANHVFVQVLTAGNLNYTNTDEQVISFDSTFTWDGHSSVLFAVNRQHGDYLSGASFTAHNHGASKMRYSYTDSAPYDINTVSSGTASSTVGDIKLISCGAGCPAPVVASIVNDYSSATVTVTGSGNGFELTYGTDIANLGNPMTSTTGVFNLTGLTPATQYFVAIVQLCDSGAVSSPTMRNFTTDSLPCFEPTNLAVVNTTFNSAELSWTSNGNATSWIISITGAGVTRYDTVTTNPYTVTGLYADQQYSVMVMAVCGGGAAESGWSDAVTFTTDICTPVSNVTVDNITASSATVNWNAAAGSMGYKLFYGFPGFYDTEAQTAEVGASSTSYTITGLAAETAYEVYVLNRCTETLYSNVTANDRVGFTTIAGNGIYDVETGTLTLYPNPASTTVTLTVSGFDGEVEVEIVDMNGKRVSALRTQNSELQIDLGQIATGAYFVRVTGEHQTAVRKLIVK